MNSLENTILRCFFTILPTHKETSIFSIYRKDIDVAKLFNDCAIKIVSGETFKNTYKDFSSHYIRIRVPGDIEQCREIINRITFKLNNSY